MNYEKPTDEYRLVQQPLVKSNGICGPGYAKETVGYQVTLQRKWIVQDGEPYRAERPLGDAVQTAEWHFLGPNIGFEWTPIKEEWRDCPSILGKEIEL